MSVVQYDLGQLTGTQRESSPNITAFYAYPATASASNKVPAIVNIHGGGQTPDWFSTWWWATQGYACVSINWGGNPLTQIVSTPLTASNYTNTNWDGFAAGFIRSGVTEALHHEPVSPDTYTDGSTLYAESHPLNASFMLNSYAARRALTFLTQRPEVDTTKLGVTGHSMGGITTTITGTDSRVKAIAPSVGGTGWDYELYWGTQQANKFLYLSMNPQFQEWGMIPTAQELSDYDYYVRTVSQESYWPSINAPALFIGATNDFNSPFDRIQPSIDLMPAGIESNVSISTHYNHGFIDSTEITQALWLDTHLKGSFDYPTQGDASLDLTRASGIPVYSVTPDQSVASAVSKVDIYYGYERMPLERFWHEATAFEVSPGTWEAPCPVFDTNDPLFAYAVITYDLGYEKNFTFGKTSSSFNVASSTKIAYPEDLTANDIVADNSLNR